MLSSSTHPRPAHSYMHNSFLSLLPAPKEGPSFSTKQPKKDVVRGSMNFFSDCLGADTWLSAEISLAGPDCDPSSRCSSLIGKDVSISGHQASPESKLLKEGLLAEREERTLWAQNRLEDRRFFATYEVVEDPIAVMAFSTDANGLLRGTAFFSESPFTREDLWRFRRLFDQVASQEGRMLQMETA